MQAVSGAGYPGVPSLDAIDNIVPLVAESEEHKMNAEPIDGTCSCAGCSRYSRGYLRHLFKT